MRSLGVEDLRRTRQELVMLPADGFIRGTMTGLLCSLGMVRDVHVEEEEGDGEEEGTPEDSLSPLFVARTE